MIRNSFIVFACVLGLQACGDDGEQRDPDDSGKSASEAQRYVLGSVTIDADGNRVSYAQIIDSLEGLFTNKAGLETAGNAVFLTHGNDFFYGQAESPEWVRYSTHDGFAETGRLSFLNYGISYMDFANVIIDDETAVSVLTEAYVAVVWNPQTMTITGTIDLSSLRKDGYLLEAYTTVAHEKLVYVPAKWVNWEAATVLQLVNVTVLDPKKLEIVASAEDDRCGAAGRVTFERGYTYVMGDGRNQSMQEFAAARGEPAVPNCLLRIPPGGTDFEEDFFYTIPELTGGLDSMTEMEPARLDSGIAFLTMKYEDRIPEDVDRVKFEHWTVPAYKRWRLTLGDVPRAEEVQGANFSVVGFSASAVDGKLYASESPDGRESTVFELDPVANTAVEKFTMEGYFAALLPLEN